MYDYESKNMMMLTSHPLPKYHFETDFSTKASAPLHNMKPTTPIMYFQQLADYTSSDTCACVRLIKSC